MAGYIGSKSSVTQVDGYNRTEADGRYVNASGDTMTGTLSVTGVDRNEDALRVGASSAGTGYGLRIGASGATDPLEIWREHSSGDQMQLSVDYYGRVTMPYQPAFAVVGSTATFVGLNVAGTVQLNVGGHFNNTLGRFTAPVSGNYLFTFSLTTGDAQKHFIDIGLNGSAALGVVGGLHLSYDTTYQNGSVTTVYPLSAGDFVEAKRRGTDYAVYRATFSGYLIG